jgi:hypothetical protein
LLPLAKAYIPPTKAGSLTDALQNQLDADDKKRQWKAPVKGEFKGVLKGIKKQ